MPQKMSQEQILKVLTDLSHLLKSEDKFTLEDQLHDLQTLAFALGYTQAHTLLREQINKVINEKNKAKTC